MILEIDGAVVATRVTMRGDGASGEAPMATEVRILHPPKKGPGNSPQGPIGLGVPCTDRNRLQHLLVHLHILVFALFLNGQQLPAGSLCSAFCIVCT